MGSKVIMEAYGMPVERETEGFKLLREKFQLEGDHTWRMYVKPFSKAGVEDLNMLMKSAYARERVWIEEKNGTYCITSRQPIDKQVEYVESLWGILHRKFERQSTELACENAVSVSGFKRALKWHENDLGLPVAEKDRDKNFYVFVLSPQFIEATALPRFRMAG